MDAKLISVVDRIGATAGVTGIAISDPHGLCLHAKGTLPADAAGDLQGIMSSAAKLAPDREMPTILIETVDKEILLASSEGITTSVERTRLKAEEAGTSMSEYVDSAGVTDAADAGSGGDMPAEAPTKGKKKPGKKRKGRKGGD